jgi:hypothetical protein
VKGLGRGLSGGSSNDSLQKRDKYEDSITITFRYIDTARGFKLDSSISDFTDRYPIPATNIFLSNTGSASRSILFSPLMKPGFDPGFHAFDTYKWKLEEIRFFNTTRPYSVLSYLLGSRSEQQIEIIHTQNIKPNWNALFQYRLINSPGFFKNQKTSHNNYLLTSWYESKKKRYNNYFAVLANNLQASENGGIKDDKDYLSDPDFKDRFNIFTNLGGDEVSGRNFFSPAIATGNRYKEFTAIMRQQYDIGKKDSLVKDSTVIPLFYPRLRFEHTLQYNSKKYEFLDYDGDSVYYKKNYDTTFANLRDTVYLRDKWKEITNDFSIYQYPDAKNLQQFIKAGMTFQYLQGLFPGLKKSFYNLIGHFEYRNKTRNKKWDIEAFGKLYFNGLNAGDYHAVINLKSFVGKKIGYLEAGFENVNRSPAFTFDERSAFYFLDAATDFKKENTTHIFASYFQPRLLLRLSGNYYLVSNYMYFGEFYKPKQQEAVFNLLQVSLEKITRLGKKWNLYTDIYVQQKAGASPVNVPLVFTRNRVTLEGIYYKNLNLSTGLEVRYHTPYKADGYSPAIGQFVYQDSVTINNRPDITAFLHFRIRSFKGYVRAENLNTMSFKNGFGFTNNNFAAPSYVYPGLVIRFGVYWNFVN